VSTYPAILAAFFIVVGAWWLASIPFALVVGRMMRDRNAALAEQAADWDEPTRADVEADWRLFDADEFTETPIFARMRWEQDVHFAASVLADIDDLPEV
jgi:hypothetical protein